jgi:hypothetical protein
VHDRNIASALASNATNAIGRAIYLWESDQDLSLEAAWDNAWDSLIEAAKLLGSSAK